MPNMAHRNARRVAAASNTCLMTFMLLPLYIAAAPFIAASRAITARRRAEDRVRAGWDV
jgi:hypothetical protein